MLAISTANITNKFASLTTSEIPLIQVYDVITEPANIDKWRAVRSKAADSLKITVMNLNESRCSIQIALVVIKYGLNYDSDRRF